MSAMPSHTQPELSAASLLLKPSAETAAVRPADPKNDQLSNARRSLGGQAPLAFARNLIAFTLGVTATLAWQSYGDAVRRVIAPVTPADQQQFSAISLDLDAVRRSIDGLATGLATSIARSQEQMTRSVDQLAAGLEQMTREIVKLQAVEQSVLNKNSEPVPRPAPAQLRNPVPRPAPSPIALSPPRNP
jgi:hypothetical protein